MCFVNYKRQKFKTNTSVTFQIGEDYGLSDLCKGAVTVNSVPGTHESCVVDSAQLIAQHIAKQIN